MDGAVAARRTLLLALAASVLALGINAALNAVTMRPRPFLVLSAHVLVPRPHDTSFPSDHTAVSSAIATVLLLSEETLWGWPALAGAALIGAARVAVGVHYPSDVVGGMLVGAVSGFAMIRARRPAGPLLDAIIETAKRMRLG